MLLIVSPFPMRAFVPFDNAKLLLFDSATKKTHPTSSENLLKKRGNIVKICLQHHKRKTGGISFTYSRAFYTSF